MSADIVSPVSTHMDEERKPMLHNLQALRALAAVLVVLHHNIGGVFIWGHYGVDVFFVISGFIMVHVLNEDARPLAFFVRRIIRIVPIYWLVTLAIFAVGLALPGALQSSDGDWGELAKSLFFIPYYSEDRAMYHPIVHVGWTLNYEMFFYLVFGACIALRRRGLIVGVCTAILLGLVGLGQIVEGGRIFAFYTDPILLEFAAGMLLALVWHKWRLGPVAAWGLVALCLVAFIVLDPIREHYGRGILIGPFALLMVAAAMAAENAGHAITNRFVLLLGAASYSLYLTHVYVLGGLERLPLPDWLLWLWVPLVPAVAVALYLVVEKPSNRFLRRLLPR